MDFVFSLLSNPIVFWALIALGLLVAYQKLAPRIRVHVPGLNLTPDDIVGKLLGPRYAEAKLKRAVEQQRKSGNYLMAGRLYEDRDRLADAAEVYLAGQEQYAAAAVFERMGKLDRAGELFLQAGDYKKAAQVFSQAGKHTRAAQLFQEKGNNLEAARLYSLGGQWDKAAALYEKSGFGVRAAEAYEKCGQPLKAAEAHERHFMENVTYATTYSSTASSPDQKSALLAGRLYEKAGDLKRALEIYQKGSYFKEAAQACLKLDQPAKAAELFMRAEDSAAAADAFEKAGDAVQAANLRGEAAFKAGRPAEAAVFFQQGKDYLRAAELFEAAGMLKEAAGAYEAGDSFAAAGSVYVRAGAKDRAAAAYERGGDAETAAKLYDEVGNTAKAIELFDRAGHTFKSGEAAAKAGDHERAIALLQRVPATDESYVLATELLAGAFVATNRPALAVERVQKAIGTQPISASTLGLYYWLASAQEAAGKGTEALATYKKIQAEDLSFRDVEKRVKKLQTGVSQSSVEGGAPDRVGKYLLGPRIGQGAMGEVFRGHDPLLRRDVAIKMISASLAPETDMRARFEREAQSAARLNHPNIVTIYEFGHEHGRIYLVMELLEGSDLRGVLNRHGLVDLTDKLSIMEQVCDGLAYAHSHEVVHRDLKPGNIHVLPGVKAKVLDFGLARLGSAEFTQSGVILGTPNYMSPEQARGERATARSDVFSLGALFYEILSGKKAFEGDAMQGVLYQVMNAEPESLRKRVKDLPEALIAVVEKALVKDPEKRFRDAGEMREALRPVRRALPAPTPARPYPVGAPSESPQRAPTVVQANASSVAAAEVRAAVPAQSVTAPAAPAVVAVPPPASPPAAPLPTSAKGARFLAQEEVGRGPKGVVYRGIDSTGGATVALRFLPDEPLQVAGAMPALAADLKAAAAAPHPNLVKLIGFVEIAGKRCVVTELVGGKNFAEPLLAGRRVPFAHILKLTRALGETLGVIHGRGQVHGGIQPANLLASGGVVKIADLGLGRVFQQVSRAREYWPPDGRFEPATDLYAAAATVYHLLTGVGPRNRPYTPPSALVPGVPSSFDALLLRALDPHPEGRFPSAAALLQALDQLGGPPA